MTAKERQRMQRLETENRLLRERMSLDMRIYGENITEIIELKATIELIRMAMEDHKNDAANS